MKASILTPPAVNIAVNKTISNELGITIHVIASQLSGHCDVNSKTKREQVRQGDHV